MHSKKANSVVSIHSWNVFLIMNTGVLLDALYRLILPLIYCRFDRVRNSTPMMEVGFKLDVNYEIPTCL